METEGKWGSGGAFLAQAIFVLLMLFGVVHMLMHQRSQILDLLGKLDALEIKARSMETQNQILASKLQDWKLEHARQQALITQLEGENSSSLQENSQLKLIVTGLSEQSKIFADRARAKEERLAQLITFLREEVQASEAQLAQATHELTSRENLISGLKDRTEALQTKVAEGGTSYLQLISKNKELEQEVASYEDRINEMIGEIRVLNTEIEEAEAAEEDARSALASSDTNELIETSAAVTATVTALDGTASADLEEITEGIALDARVEESEEITLPIAIGLQ